MSFDVVSPAALPTELRPPLSYDEALLEADRCLACGGLYAEAPCTAACPARVDVSSFVEAIADGDVLAAAETIFAENILGGDVRAGVPGRGSLRRSLRARSRGSTTDPDRRLATVRNRQGARGRAADPAARWPTGRKVAVVGAGPAGLACAGELAARRPLGHCLRSARRDRRSCPLRDRAVPRSSGSRSPPSSGLSRRSVCGSDSAPSVTCLDRLAGYDAVFLGVGLGADVELELPGGDLPGVWESLPFIEALKTGDSARGRSARWS